MIYTDIRKFEDQVALIAGDVAIQAKNNTEFQASLAAIPHNSIGFMCVDTSPVEVEIKPSSSYYTLSLPMSNALRIARGSLTQEIVKGQMHITSPHNTYYLDTGPRNNCLVFRFDALNSEIELDIPFKLERFNSDVIKTCNHPGNVLYRAIINAWSWLSTHKGPPNTTILDQVELNVSSAFCYWLDHGTHSHSVELTQAQFKLVKDYLNANLKKDISRQQLEKIAGCNIRTISRNFRKYLGMGPMTYLRQQRLNAAYQDLHAASPEMTSVGEVATSYRLNHLGKFSVLYKETFGESPSLTLRRHKHYFIQTPHLMN